MYERLLRLIGPAHVIGGLLLFSTGFIPSAQHLLESLFVTSDDFIWSPFFVAVLGPTIASWGVLFSAVVRQYLNTRAPGAWRTLVIAAAVWVLFDTLLCVYFGLNRGALFNAGMIVLLAIALCGVRPWASRR